VVVIGLGQDAREHFPAAVAGEIYRNLNHRFGMAGSQQLASSKLPTYKRAPLVIADDDAEGEKGEEVGDEANSDNAMNRTSSSMARKTLWTNKDARGNSTVKRVLMSIPKRTEEVVKPATYTKSEQKATRPRFHSALVQVPR
jgi:hypothetical protein